MKISSDKKIVVIGAGITGLTAAVKLSEKNPGQVVLVEKEAHVGGLAATIESGGIKIDLGSHRIHPNYDGEVLQFIKELLGPDLLRRPRLGYILIKNKWVQYPPSVFDFFFKFGFKQFFFYFSDYLIAFFKRLRTRNWPRDFESYGKLGVGESLYRDFYAPYARKLWGVSPDQISYEPALSRLRKFEVRAFLKELLFTLKKSAGLNFFYYPVNGIGQISEKLLTKFLENGGVFYSQVKGIEFNISDDKRVESIRFLKQDNSHLEIKTDLVISTIPMRTLHSLINSIGPDGNRPPWDLKTRSLRILFIITEEKVFHPNETFYIPDPSFRVGRVSEVKKYSPSLNERVENTVLTIEIPCSKDDDIWRMGDSDLYEICLKELIQLKILSGVKKESCIFFSQSIENLYPIFETSWKSRFFKIYKWLDQIPNLFMIGRSALFLHCNIDHCFMMGMALARYLEKSCDKEAWGPFVGKFLRFQVKD